MAREYLTFPNVERVFGRAVALPCLATTKAVPQTWSVCENAASWCGAMAHNGAQIRSIVATTRPGGVKTESGHVNPAASRNAKGRRRTEVLRRLGSLAGHQAAESVSRHAFGRSASSKVSGRGHRRQTGKGGTSGRHGDGAIRTADSAQSACPPWQGAPRTYRRRRRPSVRRSCRPSVSPHRTRSSPASSSARPACARPGSGRPSRAATCRPPAPARPAS